MKLTASPTTGPPSASLSPSGMSLPTSFHLLPALSLDERLRSLVDSIAVEVAPHLLRALSELTAEEAADSVQRNLPGWCAANGVSPHLAEEGLASLAALTPAERAQGSLFLWARMVALSRMGAEVDG